MIAGCVSLTWLGKQRIMAIPGLHSWAFSLGTCSGYTAAPALPTAPGFPFVESRAEEEAAAGAGPTLIKSQELGRALGSVLKL